jgi:hypothetical protein
MVAPVLIYTIYMFWDPDPVLAQEALDVLVNFRNPQHALITTWLNWTVLVQALVLLAGLILLRKTKLFTILLIVTSAVITLTIIQVVSANQRLALIFPWRVSVLLVPMGTTILIAFGVTKFMDWLKEPRKAERWVSRLSFLVMVGLIIVGAIRFQVESLRQLADPALPMMNYVAAHKSPGDIYMIPSKMENFRLVTGAPILVDFKSAPDRDADVMEWRERLKWVSWFYQGTKSCKIINDIVVLYGVTHVVTVKDYAPTECESLPVLYEDTTYRIYMLPPKK